MILFRPRAADFQTAMRQIQLFDSFNEMDDYLIHRASHCIAGILVAHK